jgi:hypothetical protein
MIYSKFGTALSLVSKTQSASGAVSVQARVDGSADLHEYDPADLKADDGSTEISQTVAKLPLKVFESRVERRSRHL